MIEKEAWSRTEKLLGPAGILRLQNAKVLIFGLGGVGGEVVECLARSGVGELHLVDGDVFSTSNLNRQIFALTSTLGQAKADVARQRILTINPQCKVITYPFFYTPETASQFDWKMFDYVVDAVDMVTAKLDIVLQAYRHQVPVISAMGAGNKIHPEMVQISDISSTSVCPLARVMRKELKKRGIEHLKVAYSKEIPYLNEEKSGDRTKAKFAEKGEKITAWSREDVGSMVFVPKITGLLIANEVVQDILIHKEKANPGVLEESSK